MSPQYFIGRMCYCLCRIGELRVSGPLAPLLGVDLLFD
jgi:hypothetical protein